MPANKKAIAWIGDSKDTLSAFPDKAKIDLGHALHEVQCGREPEHWKPFDEVGPGAREVIAQDADGWYRVFYVAKFGELIYVLHAFQKKTNKTSKADIANGQAGYKAALNHHNLRRDSLKAKK